MAKFFPKLVKKCPSPQSIIATDITSLRQFFHPMGLKKRVEWLISLMKEVCERHNCKIPDQEDELVELPGVGLYTARAILCFGFNKDVSILDVNVARVLSRIFRGSDYQKRPSKDTTLWALAADIIPVGLGPSYNEAILDFASLICRKNPLCNVCPVNKICAYYTLI